MITNIEELHKKLEQLIADGYGKKPIYVEESQYNYTIDSVQKNTNPDIEPDYYFLMAGDVADDEY